MEVPIIDASRAHDQGAFRRGTHRGLDQSLARGANRISLDGIFHPMVDRRLSHQAHYTVADRCFELAARIGGINVYHRRG
jgi:hypothetical protein